MNDSVELESAYWLDLVNRDCDELEVQDALERHGVSVDEVQWIDGAGWVALPSCGIRLMLRKLDATGAACVIGVEFAVAGLDGGGSYDGSLPHGIDGGDTLMDITLKLHPATLSESAVSGSLDAVFPEHRLVIRMDGDDMLQSLTWATTRARGDRG